MIKIFNKNESFLKIGITKNTIQQRFERLKYYKIEKIFEKSLPLNEAFIIEQNILKLFKPNKYIPKHKFSGYTECLNLDILETILQSI